MATAMVVIDLCHGSENMSYNRCLNGSEALNRSPAEATGMTNSMEEFSRSYEEIHGYIALVVCLFGVFTNIVNIIVLMQPSMRSATNYLLTALAVADFFTMFFYLPYVIYLNILTSPNEEYGHTYAAVWFVLFLNNSFIISHAISNWITVSLAVFRYIAVCHHTLSSRLCSQERAKFTIVLVTTLSVLITFPVYFCYEPYHRTDNNNSYWMKEAPMCTYDEGIIYQLIFWLYGIVIKIASSILLSVLSGLLIYAMHMANAKRRRLLHQGRREESDRTSDHNRTTAMLVAVVLSFVVTEAPQGVVALLGGSDDQFLKSTYMHLGDLMDILTLINSSVNFIMYCSMSRKFRYTFKKIFVSTWLKKLVSNSSRETRNNNGLYTAINKTDQTVV